MQPSDKGRGHESETEEEIQQQVLAPPVPIAQRTELLEEIYQLSPERKHEEDNKQRP